jgi:hypothetical protein
MTLKPTTTGRGAGDRGFLPGLGSLAIALLIAGCASYDGRGLVPGQSRAADVKSLMGTPGEKISASSGESLWFYPRLPFARQTFAVRLGADGVVRSVDQRLTVENVHKLAPGTPSSAVRELLGPPWRVSRLDRQQREVWEYTMYDAAQDPFNLYVQLSGGVVREVLMLRELVNEPCAT